MNSMWFFKLVLFLFSLPQLLQMNIPVWEFFSIYSSKTTRSVNNRLREKWILGPFEVGLHVLSHVVAVIVGQSLSTDATTEYAFFVSVNHWLDKGIHTCEIDWVKGGCSDSWHCVFTGRHARCLYPICELLNNVRRDYFESFDSLALHTDEWLTYEFRCGSSYGVLLPWFSGTQCIWISLPHCSLLPWTSYHWLQHLGLRGKIESK